MYGYLNRSTRLANNYVAQTESVHVQRAANAAPTTRNDIATLTSHYVRPNEAAAPATTVLKAMRKLAGLDLGRTPEGEVADARSPRRRVET